MSKNKCKSTRILIAGGGTGGHFFPALAIAEALVRLRANSEVRLVGTPWGLEARLESTYPWRLHRIWVRGWFKVGWWRKLLVLLMLPVSLVQCFYLLLTWRPALVLGVGGYASGPALLVALLLRYPTAIQEQNIAAGMTNRWLGRWVGQVFVSSSAVRGFPRLRVTGTPVRREIVAIAGKSRPTSDHLQLLVLGGSQGARLLNQTIAQAAPILAKGLMRHKLKLKVLHQTGQADLAFSRESWQKVASQRLLFRCEAFLNEMPHALLASHLVYSRAGASATAEFCAAGRACLLTPIARSSGDHQRANAKALVQAGAAVMLEEADISPALLAKHLLALLSNNQLRQQMEKKIAKLHHPDAADSIAKLILAAS